MRCYLTTTGRRLTLLPESFLPRLPAEAKTYQPILTRFGYVLLANETMVTIPEGTALPAPPPIPGHGR